MDHLLVSRSEEELKKRVIYLVQSIEKEFESKRKSLPQQEMFVSEANFKEVEQEVKRLMAEAEI